MLRKLGLDDLYNGMKDVIEANTAFPFYDEAPDNLQTPYFYLQTVNQEKVVSETMYCEIITVWVHAIAQSREGSGGIYDIVQQLKEAMAGTVNLPDHVALLLLTEQVLQAGTEEPSGGYHAVVAYDFEVAYGYKTK